jgi:hypothetical protein
MKKPCRGEITGLKTELQKVSSILLILFLFIINESFAQIPINGFCKFNSFKVDSNFTSVFSLNFNKDSYTDLILFNPEKKQILALTGDKNGNISRQEKYFLPVEISNIIDITNSRNKITGYAFTSRKNREVGIYDFTSKGRPLLRNVYKFDSYPENISYASVDNREDYRFLISGSAFKGLSVLYLNKNKFIEEKITEEGSYSNALFVDVNNDFYPDIVAFNLLKRSIDFYYNNGLGEFNKTRTIKINDQISALQSFDVNLDQINDLIYSSGKNINIFYGDAVGSYDQEVKLETNFYPTKIIPGDFNRDGKIDIAYINSDEGLLSILYAKNETEFYPEVIYYHKEQLSDLIPYYSRFINGIAFLSSKGYLFTVSRIKSLADDISLSLGAEPGAISYFDTDNNGINDICFIDNFNNYLNLVVRNNSGIPWMLYRTRLFEKEKMVIADDTNPGIKTFYCYTPGKKLIEVISYNFENGKIERNSLYTPGGISDLKILPIKGLNSKIYVSYMQDDVLGLNEFFIRDSIYVSRDFPNIASNVLASNLTVINGSELFYWQRKSNSQVLFRSTLVNQFKNAMRYYRLGIKDTTLINSFAGDFFNNEEATSVNFFETPKSNFAVLSTEDSPIVVVDKDLGDHFRIKNKNLLFFGELKPGGLKRLFIYVPDEGALHRVDFIKRGRKIVVTNVVTNIAGGRNVLDYFIKNMNYRSYNFVYTDSVDRCIKIKQLPK